MSRACKDSGTGSAARAGRATIWPRRHHMDLIGTIPFLLLALAGGLVTLAAGRGRDALASYRRRE